ncbi:YqaJ viral recombinase family protein [Caballeronia zhejiangensis]|uniref:Endonuclease n=1 Tax=Caballeronia zhejiangensis TaxID=871203 RepID=A0A656QNU8_9BURK|nr:YqaJ viral recombinase family protein [Caballeronia zhejiangensis]KDR31538.1 endonuclease [Caballeronia zhejiangensis]
MRAPDEWLVERRRGIGGSDAAAAIGQSRYRTAYELWLDKTGQSPFQQEETELTRFGRAMEAIAAGMFAQRMGVRLQRRNAIIRHPRYAFMAASVDRLIVGRREGFEAKNVNADYFKFSGEWGEEGSDHVPVEYLLQCAHYMTVLDCDAWHLGAVVGGNRLVTYAIERDREFSELLIEQEARFWTYVEAREPPPFDYSHGHALPILKRLYPGTNGEAIDLDASLLDWHHVKQDADEHVKRYQAVSDGARAHILHAMGEAAIGRLSNGGAYKRLTVHRPAYDVDDCDYISLRYMKPKGAVKESDE